MNTRPAPFENRLFNSPRPPTTATETIAEGSGIRERPRLREQFGDGLWRKKKGIAQVQLPDGRSDLAELHRYEPHGIGKVKLRMKRWLDS